MGIIMKIGILGGTFDPIHRAHLALGRAAHAAFDLEYVLVIPTGNPYFKTTEGNVTSIRHRSAMVKLAIDGDPVFRYSDIETSRSGCTYTADTLRELTEENPEDRYFFITGADTLAYMKEWYKPEIVFRCADIIAASRASQIDGGEFQEEADYLRQRYGAVIHFLKFPDMNVSSTQIREEIRNGRLPHPDLAPAVNDYIREHGLYGKQRSAEEIQESLKKRLKPSRYRHTLGVMETAEKLARHYGTVDPERARLAGLLHDCGKNEGSALTHGPVGAEIAREEYGVKDEDILNAIRWHTTGRPGMTDLEKIIFIADYIEPGRDRAPRLDELRKMAFQDMDKTIVCILEDTLSYLQKSGVKVDGQSIDTYNYYKNRNNFPA